MSVNACLQQLQQTNQLLQRSSMQKDLAAKRQLELDAIGGPIVRGGERDAINVSTTAALIAVIRAKVTE